MAPIDDGTLTEMREGGVLPMAWSLLAGGRLFDPTNETAQRIAKAVEAMAPRYAGAGVDNRPTPGSWPIPAGRCRSSAATAFSGFARRPAAVEIARRREDWYALWQAAQGEKCRRADVRIESIPSSTIQGFGARAYPRVSAKIMLRPVRRRDPTSIARRVGFCGTLDAIATVTVSAVA